MSLFDAKIFYALLSSLGALDNTQAKPRCLLEKVSQKALGYYNLVEEEILANVCLQVWRRNTKYFWRIFFVLFFQVDRSGVMHEQIRV